jgi:hypothetical protein
MPAQQQNNDLEILEERVMIAIPRGDEELRVTFTRARTSQGRDVAWHSLRIFWRADTGEWRPGKQGITIRGRELRPVVDALLKALSGAAPVAPPSVRRPEHRRTTVPLTEREITEDDRNF